MKKKHVAVHKDLEDQKQSISSMNSEQSRLETVIKASSDLEIEEKLKKIILKTVFHTILILLEPRN